MTDRITLGEGLTCDLDILTETRLLINAASGGGKSRTIRRLAEQAHGRVQQIIIDPEGEFPSLREKFDYLIAAPHGGDCVADPRAAGLLATRLLEIRVSAVVNIFDLSKARGERKRFVRLFVEALMAAPRSLWHPVLIIVDESQDYAPEGDESEALGPMIDLAAQGRKRGFALIAATQRLSKLSKDVAAELRNVMIGTTVLDVDQKRAADVLGFDTKARRELRDLEAGDFWSFGPALVKSPTLIHIGPHQTTHPKVGDRKALPAPPPTAKIKALLPQLADLPAEAEEKARTEAELKKELAAARAAITRLEKGAPAREVVKEVAKVVEKPVLRDAQISRLEGVVAKLAEIPGAWQKPLEGLAEVGRSIRELVAQHRNGAGKPANRISVPMQPRPQVAPRPAAVHPSTNGTEGLTGPQQRILDALAWLKTVGIEGAERPQLGFLAEASPKSSSFANNLGVLRSKGLIDYRGSVVQLTPAGADVAHAPDIELTVDAVQAAILHRVTGPQARILRVAIDAYPAAVPRAQLAEQAGASATSSSFANNLGFLRSLGFIDYLGGDVVAEPVLFLEVSPR